MWNSSLTGMSPRESDKSPVLEDTCQTDADGGLVLPTDVFQDDRSPATMSPEHDLLSTNYRTPLSAVEMNYIIIPLHSPQPRSLNNQILMSQAGQQTVSCSPVIRNFYSLTLTPQNNSQPYRRSPEKRFSSPGPICRICHEDDQEEQLLSPCNCSGSLALVHKSCIEKWLSASNSSECEICKLNLPVLRQTRPVWQWFAVTESSYGPQGFYADITCVTLLTPLCLISVYLCALGASDYVKHGAWEGFGLGILSFFLMSTYLLWFFVTVRYHWKTLRQWRTANQVIELDLKNLPRKANKNLNPVQNSECTSPINSLVSNFFIESPHERSVHAFHTTIQHSLMTNHSGMSSDRSHVFDESAFSGCSPVYV